MSIDADRLSEIRQMCDAPSDGYSAGLWCEVANDLLAALSDAEQRAEDIQARLTDCRGALWNESNDRESAQVACQEAERRASQAEEERDEALVQQELLRKLLDRSMTSSEAAEARAAKLEAALEVIATERNITTAYDFTPALQFARSVLADLAAEEEKA